MKNKQRCKISKSTENAEKREENGRKGKHGKEKKNKLQTRREAMQLNMTGSERGNKRR